MEGITVNILKMLVDEQVKLGNGDKVVLLSCDGNEFQPLYCGFTNEDGIRRMAEHGLFHNNNDPSEVVLLG